MDFVKNLIIYIIIGAIIGVAFGLLNKYFLEMDPAVASAISASVIAVVIGGSAEVAKSKKNDKQKKS